MAFVGKNGQSVTVDPNAMYRIKLNASAHHGSDLLRPRDDNVLNGVELDSITPPEAVQWIEKV